ncbi:MAG: hypothetical protein R3F59_22910 [Myxococcota bacterium]
MVDGNQARYTAAPVWIDAMVKADQSFDRGALLEVSIVFTEDLENDADLRDAVDVRHAKDVWRAPRYDDAVIEADVPTYAFPDGNLGPPAYGEEPAYEDIAADTDPRRSQLLASRRRSRASTRFLGIAGDIPGPLVPSPACGAGQLGARGRARRGSNFLAEDIRSARRWPTRRAYSRAVPPVEQVGTPGTLPDTPECDSRRSASTSCRTT